MYRNTACRLQAHQGVSTEAPGNTLPAFRLAAEQGYDLIETDPKITADGVCILFHDKIINRAMRTADGETVPGEIPVDSLTLEELRSYDAGLRKGEEFRGTRVPTLAEALDFAYENRMELKFDNCMEKFTPEQQERVFDVLAAHPCKVGVTGAHTDYLARAARVPGIVLHYDGPVTEEALCELDRIPDREKVVWLRYDNRKTAWCSTPPATPALAELVRRHGAAVGVWILSADEEMTDALRLGADIVETNGEIKPR